MSSRAAGQDIALDMHGCAHPAESEVRAVLNVELHNQLLTQEQLAPPDARIVEVQCTRDKAELTLQKTASKRTLALTSVPPELRARLLALSIAELVRPQPPAARARAQRNSASAQRAEAPQPQPLAANQTTPNPQASATTAAPVEASEQRPVLQLPAAGALAEAIGERDQPKSSSSDAPESGEAAGPADEPDKLGSAASASAARYLCVGAEAQATPLWGWGGALLFRAKLAPWFASSSALSLGQAQTNIDAGRLRVLSVSLRTGLAWLAQGPHGTLHAGVGVRARWLRLAGEPTNQANTTAKHFEAWSLGPAVFAGATLHIAVPWFLALELELHHALREVKALVEEGASRSLSPWQTSATLGAGLSW